MYEDVPILFKVWLEQKFKPPVFVLMIDLAFLQMLITEKPQSCGVMLSREMTIQGEGQ